MRKPSRRRSPLPSVWGARTRLALTLALALLLWEAAARSGMYTPHLFPPPTRVFGSLLGMVRSGELLTDAKASAWRWLAGFFLGNMAGLCLGLLTGRSRLARDTLGQMMNLLRCIPFIVLIPLAILWFGIDEAEKVFVVAWGVVFPVWLNSQAGIAEVEKEYVWAAQSLGAKGLRMYTKVLLPRALPFIIAGTRMAIATGVFALAAAEMAGAFSGLAHRIYYSHQMFQTERMMAGIVTVACLGLVLDRAFIWGMRTAFPWWQGSLHAQD